MDIAKLIKDLRESTGMSRKEFSEHTGIPVRTLEDWEAGRRTPPEYIPRLLAYQIKFEGIFLDKKEARNRRNVSVIQDADGNKIVVINDVVFKGKRSIAWDDVEKYLKRYVGDIYPIAEIARLSMAEMQKMGGIDMIQGLLCLYTEMMEILRDTTSSGEGF